MINTCFLGRYRKCALYLLLSNVCVKSGAKLIKICFKTHLHTGVYVPLLLCFPQYKESEYLITLLANLVKVANEKAPSVTLRALYVSLPYRRKYLVSVTRI